MGRDGASCNVHLSLEPGHGTNPMDCCSILAPAANQLFRTFCIQYTVVLSTYDVAAGPPPPVRLRGWTFSSQSRLPVAKTSRREEPNSIHQKLLDSAHHEFSKTKDSPTRGECGSQRGQFLTVGRQALSLGPITPYETLFLATSGRMNGPR